MKPWIVFPFALLASEASAQELGDVVPLKAANCAVTTPPVSAGLAVTPGGFVMVHPRNDAIAPAYSGCKILWVVDGERFQRIATLYFVDGALTRAVAHDPRDPRGAIEGACALPEGRSLLPQLGRKLNDSACRGFSGEELYGLHVPTWPRSCLTAPEAPVCKQDPR